MDAIDRAIVNALQDGLPVCERPFAAAAAGLGLHEADLIARLQALVADGTLSRFGPMYDAERLGGAYTLAAMQVPAAEFEAVAAIVNGYPEVAHNYARDHAFNLWFVLASADPDRIARVLEEIEAATGMPVHAFPKLEEYCVDLRFAV
jgi:DNA-binding Lrp family transcriptional regulator